MNSTKTFIILTPGFAASKEDTNCMPFLQHFVESFKKNNPHLNIILLSFQYPFFSGTYLWNGITVKSFNGQNRGKINRLITWKKVWSALNQINKQNEVVGILSFWLAECSLLGTYFSSRNKLKHYTWLLGQDARRGNKYQRFINPHESGLIALSDFVSNEYFLNYKSRPAHVIPVGIKTSMFRNDQPKRDIDVLGVGSLIPLKRYDLFIEIIQKLVVSFPELTVVICGDGPQKYALQQLVDKLELKNNIKLVGEMPYAVVLKLMQRTKVFLHPSEYEGYGAVCAEALYAGAHVVSFCQPMKQISPQHHIVKTKNEAFEIILEILKDENRNHETILTNSIDEVSEQMLKLFGQ